MPIYGPYWRWQSETQPLISAALQVIHGEMWGRIPAFNSGLLQVPTVQAYSGRLPDGRSGVEFFTEIEPGDEQPSVPVRWFVDTPGVEPTADEEDTVKIPVWVTKVDQFRPDPLVASPVS